jgi:hypothetical protein
MSDLEKLREIWEMSDGKLDNWRTEGDKEMFSLMLRYWGRHESQPEPGFCQKRMSLYMLKASSNFVNIRMESEKRVPFRLNKDIFCYKYGK